MTKQRATAVAICTLVIICLVGTSAPWSGEFYPEGNWLGGPLHLLAVRSIGDKQIGAFWAFVLIGAALYGAWRCDRWGMSLIVASAVLWVMTGIYLAMMAVA